MGLKDYLNPAWKSGREEVRKKFIENLSPHKDLTKTMIKILNSEKNPKIRKLALKKILSEEQAVEIMEKLSAEMAKRDLREHLMDLVTNRYVEGKLKNEAYLDFLEPEDKFVELFFLVKDFNKKRKLLEKINTEEGLLKVMRKLDLKDKDITKLILSRLAGAEVLLAFLESGEWERLREKYSIEIFNALKANETLFQNYKVKTLKKMEEEIIASVKRRITNLSQQRFITEHTLSPQKLTEELKRSYVFNGRGEPFSEGILAEVEEYQKLYLTVQEDQQYKLNLQGVLQGLKDWKGKINDLGAAGAAGAGGIEELEKEMNSLEEHYSALPLKIKDEEEVKTALDSLKKDLSALMLARKAQEQKKRALLEALKKQEDALRVLKGEINGLKDEMSEHNFLDFKPGMETLREGISSFKKMDEPALQALLMEVEGDYEALSARFKALERKSEESKTLAQLMDLEQYFEELDLGREDLERSMLNKKIVHWEKLLNSKFLEQEDFAKMLEKHKKLLLEIKKELEEQEFRTIQSHLDKKEALCRVLEEVLHLEDKEKVLKVLFQITRKWNNLPVFNSFYFKEVNHRYLVLKKECQKITKDHQEDFKKLQKDKIKRKEDLIAELEKIIQVKKVDKKTTLQVEKILEEWKSIFIYLPFNERELNLEFRQKLNFFFKQKKSEKLHAAEIGKNNLIEKKKWLDKFQKQMEKISAWSDKLNFMKQGRRNWAKLAAGFPFEENLAIDEKYFALLEEQFEKQGSPLEKRIALVKKRQMEISSLATGERPDFPQFKKSWILFHRYKKLLSVNLLPQKDYSYFKKTLAHDETNFRSKNAKWFAMLEQELDEVLTKKKSWLEKITEYNQAKNFDYKKVEEVKGLIEEWEKLERVHKSKSPDLENDFRKNVGLFYKNLRESAKNHKKSTEENYLAKKKILNSLNRLADWGDEEGFKVAKDFNPAELKDIWEYNRQFKGSKQQKVERKREIFLLLKKWNEKLDLTFQQKKELDKYFHQIKIKLKKKNFIQ